MVTMIKRGSIIHTVFVFKRSKFGIIRNSEIQKELGDLLAT